MRRCFDAPVRLAGEFSPLKRAPVFLLLFAEVHIYDSCMNPSSHFDSDTQELLGLSVAVNVAADAFPRECDLSRTPAQSISFRGRLIYSQSGSRLMSGCSGILNRHPVIG